MRFQSYFNTAVRIIQSYDGNIPLHHFLKQYFSQHKKHGSKDRKIITHACYNFYRLGRSLAGASTEEKLKIAIFICNDNAGEWSFLYDDEWLANWNTLLQQRIDFIKTRYSSFSLDDVFPFANEVSESLDIAAFTRSFFIQPDVFLRIRPGYKETVINKLQQHTIDFSYVDENAIALPPLVNIQPVINIDEEAVIQDLSSQRIREFLELVKSANFSNPKSAICNLQSVWDCCAASGGKSILAYDVFGTISLTVSDVRASILHNLKERFKKAGIKNYTSFVADITNPQSAIRNLQSAIPNPQSAIEHGFDLVICDAPCTGSGTWSRTPEQLYFFQQEEINVYALLQQRIVDNVIPSLNNNGFFLYITCSVFAKENEMIVDFIKQQYGLTLIKMELLEGYHRKADTMFAALFRKNN